MPRQKTETNLCKVWPKKKEKRKDKRNQLFTWGNLHSQPKPTLFLPPELENCVQNLCKNRFSEAVLKKTCSFSITSCLLF